MRYQRAASSAVLLLAAASLAGGCGARSDLASGRSSGGTGARPACERHATEDECEADKTCRWLVPACTQPAGFPPGCHERDPCTSDADCGGEETCQSVLYNPCWHLPCDACGGTTKVCMP